MALLNYPDIISEIYQQVKAQENKGKIATYIPELATIDPENFGIHLSTIDNIEVGLGNYRDKFSIQSISKVLSLTLAF